MKSATRTTMRPAMAACALAAVLVAAPAGAAPGWELIGQARLSGFVDRDTIRVDPRKWHRRIMLCVERGPVRVLDLDVRFGNGERQDVRVRQVIEPRRCTAPKDLAGGRRHIERIRLSYARIAPGPSPIVSVYAR